MSAPRSRTAALANAIYRRAIVVLPRPFRVAFGAELTACFEDIAREARKRGRRAVASVTLRALLDLVTQAPQHHLAAARAGLLGTGGGWMCTWQEVRFAVRRLRQHPSFTLASVLTLGLGIAATTSVFSLVYGVVLRPLPYPDADRIVEVDHGGTGLGIDRGLGITFGFYRFYAERLRTVQAIALYSPVELTLTGRGEPIRLGGVRASASLGAVLGIPPRAGRWFSADDAAVGAPPTVILSERLWRDRFGGDPAVVGRTVELGSETPEIVGIMPASFAFPDLAATFWIPRAVPSTGIGGWNERAVARLAPGVDPAGLEREINALLPTLRQTADDQAVVAQYLDDARIAPRIVSLKQHIVGDVRGTLWVLLGTVGLVLLIAVANVTNLFLVRTDEDQRANALRRALGAQRGRLITGSLAETLIVALASGVVGIGVAAAAVQILSAGAPVSIPRLGEVGLDLPVLGAAVGITLLAAIVLGLVPAFRQGQDPGVALQEGSHRATAGRHRLGGRNLLVVVQVALALMLLIGSGLLFRTFIELRSVDLGFERRQALTFELGLPGSRYGTRAEAKAFNDALLERLRAIHGVESAAAIGRCLPLRGNMCWGETLQAEGMVVRDGEVPPVTGARVVTTDYFRALRIPVRGRAFDPQDEAGAATVAILSQAAAEAYFPGLDPIGRRISFGTGRPWHTVVGVAGNVRGRVDTDDFLRVIYLPMLPETEDGPGPGLMAYVLATAVPPSAVAGAVREAVAELDPGLPLARLRTLQGLIDDATAPAAFTLTLFGAAAAMALLLGAVGVYAVIAYAVSRRTAEIGVRLALGAQATDVRRMVLRQGGVVVLMGAGIGLAGAFALARVLRGMLFGVSPTDPASFAALTVVLLAVAGLALYLPARRASRLDPMLALRNE